MIERNRRRGRFPIGQAGYSHDGHRAVDDCLVLLEVLAGQVDGSASTAFAELYEASQRSHVRIFAENSPFDMKDHLKARGYRRWRRYRQTVTELGRMSSRELQDLGVNRADIRSVARRSVAR